MKLLLMCLRKNPDYEELRKYILEQTEADSNSDNNDKHDILFALCPVLAHLGRTADVCVILGMHASDNVKVIPYCLYAIGIFKNEIKGYLRGLRSVIKNGRRL